MTMLWKTTGRRSSSSRTTRRQVPTPTPLPLFSPPRDQPVGISSSHKFCMETRRWQHIFTLRAGENSVARRPLVRCGHDAKLVACQERVALPRLHAQGGRRRRRGPQGPERSGKRTDKASVEHGRSSLERDDAVASLRQQRDRPPKGQAGPAHRRCNLSGKADSEGIHPPYNRGGTACPRRIPDVR